MRRTPIVLVLVGIIAIAQAAVAIADSPQYVWRQDMLAPLDNAQQYVEHGQLSSRGCVFPDDQLSPLTFTDRYVVTRQLAIDFRRCIAISERGTRPAALPEEAAPNKVLVQPKLASGTRGGGKVASPLTSHGWYTISGWGQTWYTDWFGSPLTRVTSNITRTIDFHGCVSAVSGSGYLEWWYGWELLTGYYTDTWIYYCPNSSSAGVRTWATFHGTINTNCYEWYQPGAPVSTGGSSMQLSVSTYGMSSNCGPVFKNAQVWNGNPPG